VSPALSTAADLLTVEFSHQKQVGLVERDEISKVLREQGMSARQGPDFVRLGELLGADGLLFLDVVNRETNQLLTACLAAVKPGVVLDYSEFPFPLPETGPWSKMLAQKFAPLFPKLDVLVKDAVPISLLNFRSAVRTTDGESLERQLTFVLFSQLVHVPEVFVLERQGLPLLAEEKDLKGLREEPFWNGSYLLEGIIDKSGYREGRITLGARLTPPGGQPPMDFEVEGERKKAAALTEQLVVKLLTRLKPQTSLREWKALDEANRYLEEAKWAWEWGMVPEALAASDAAWALGRKDEQCGTIRVRAAADLAVHDTPLAQRRRLEEAPFVRRAPRPWPPFWPGRKEVESANRALSAYEELCGMLSPEEPKLGSPLYYVGVETLLNASQLLQIFHYYPESRQPANEQLKELRARARTVSIWISRAPSVPRAYRSEAGVEPPERMFSNIEDHDLLLCETRYASLWQDRPEDCLDLYRDLLRSGNSVYFHQICGRTSMNPRLAAWTEQDEALLPHIWGSFVQELCNSTNALLRVEGRLFEFADASTEEQRKKATEAAVTELLATNQFHGEGESRYLISPETGDSLTLLAPFDSVGREYHRRYDPMERAFKFEKQKQYLASNTPFDPEMFSRVMLCIEYSVAEAKELQPLFNIYKSNLLASLESTDSRDRLREGIAKDDLWFLEVRLSWAQRLPVPQHLPMDGPAPRGPLEQRITSGSRFRSPAESNLVQGLSRTGSNVVARPPPVRHESGSRLSYQDWRQPPGNPGTGLSAREERSENLVTTARFYKIPRLALPPTPPGPFRMTVEGHRVLEGKVWFDVRYGWGTDWRAAAAVWDPGDAPPVVSAATITNGWRVIPYPGEDAGWNDASSGGWDEALNGVHFELFHGALYLSVWQGLMKRFLLQSNVWETLPIPVDKPTQLFALRDRLFAANEAAIYEILDNGQRTHLLASCRRRPSGSILDTLDTLGTPVLFPGPQNSLRASIGDKIYSWKNHDWEEVFSLPGIAAPAVFDDAIILRSKYPPAAKFWRLPKEGSEPELCWQEEWKISPPWSIGVPPPPYIKPVTGRGAKRQPELTLASAAVMSERSNLYFLAPHFDRSGQADEGQADFVCLQEGSSKPMAVPVQMPPGFRLSSNLSGPGWSGPVRFPSMRSVGALLLVGQPGAQGVMAIPWKDLESALSAEKARRLRISKAEE
jgi:hypothetical protein